MSSFNIHFVRMYECYSDHCVRVKNNGEAVENTTNKNRKMSTVSEELITLITVISYRSWEMMRMYHRILLLTPKVTEVEKL